MRHLFEHESLSSSTAEESSPLASQFGCKQFDELSCTNVIAERRFSHFLLLSGFLNFLRAAVLHVNEG